MQVAFAAGREIDHRVADQLAGAVVCHVATTPRLTELDPLAGQHFAGAQQVLPSSAMVV